MLLVRGEYELNEENDYSMAIVLSATALECELSFLFRKWNWIERFARGEQLRDEQIEKMLQLHRTIKEKIKQVCLLLDPWGVDKFVASDDELRDAVENRFPSLHIGTLAQDIQKTVFWPRNRILHGGFSAFGRDDAAKCYSIADLGLRILRKMDESRRQKLEFEIRRR
jgi:hypothetical protein